mmetsp:Transcript_15102/g.39238  ORF Transcript_15102/g.39238 Transcript_15102/m.39238 type:complete len:250 (-) Transcript_15102:1024-1773(-)
MGLRACWVSASQFDAPLGSVHGASTHCNVRSRLGLSDLDLVHGRIPLAHLLEELHAVADGGEQVTSEGAREVGFDDDTEHRGPCGHVREQGQALASHRIVELHLVARDIPVPLGQHVLQVDGVVGQVEVRVQHRRDDGQAVGRAMVEHLEQRLVVVQHRLEATADELGGRHLVVCQHSVALLAQAQELVQLHVHARCRAREVERVRLRLAAEVRHVDRDELSEIRALTPDDPAGPATRLTELVPRGRDA